MAASKKEHVHPDLAERIVKALPAKVREQAEVKAGGGEYTILKVNGRSVASVRDKNVRVVVPTDGSADSLKALAKLIGEAAPPKPDPKPTAEEKAAAKAKADEAKQKVEQEADKGGDDK